MMHLSILLLTCLIASVDSQAWKEALCLVLTPLHLSGPFPATYCSVLLPEQENIYIFCFVFDHSFH